MQETDIKNFCILCKTSSVDELNYGPLYSDNNIAVHLYCMLFAPGLLQKGTDDEGFQGFLFEDIRTEAKRVKRLKCKFCQEKGANLGCCIKSCRNTFHTKCALDNNLVFEFTSKYLTYCRNHKKINQKDNKKLDSECGMCYESLNKKYPEAILSPCCKNAWFHKNCMQKYALTAALLFKCPLCGCKKTDEWMKLGIFFPIRDAAWELEENAFQEFYEPIKLSCENNSCKNKCMHAGEVHMWRLCQYCGACGVHECCFKGSSDDKYTCVGCEAVINRPKTILSSRNDPVKNKSIKITGTDKKPKSLAATLFGESDVSSDEEFWNQSPIIMSNIKSIQQKMKRINSSDDENQPPHKRIKKLEPQKKPKSLASIMLGESDASDESDMESFYKIN